MAFQLTFRSHGVERWMKYTLLFQKFFLASSRSLIRDDVIHLGLMRGNFYHNILYHTLYIIIILANRCSVPSNVTLATPKL